jgi:hypothetical protein
MLLNSDRLLVQLKSLRAICVEPVSLGVATLFGRMMIRRYLFLVFCCLPWEPMACDRAGKAGGVLMLNQGAGSCTKNPATTGPPGRS